MAPDKTPAYICSWTIYNCPKDFPLGIRARLWLVGANVILPTREHVDSPYTMPEANLTREQALDKVRRSIQTRMPDVLRFDRQQDDDPCIVETWL